MIIKYLVKYEQWRKTIPSYTQDLKLPLLTKAISIGILKSKFDQKHVFFFFSHQFCRSLVLPPKANDPPALP